MVIFVIHHCYNYLVTCKLKRFSVFNLFKLYLCILLDIILIFHGQVYSYILKHKTFCVGHILFVYFHWWLIDTLKINPPQKYRIPTLCLVKVKHKKDVMP